MTRVQVSRLAAHFAIVVFTLPALGVTFMDKDYSFSVTTETYDPVNGLQLDLYLPAGANVPALKPALILVHGGAWAVGARDGAPFEGPGGPTDVDTPIHEYAKEMAKRGYVCASISYRLYGNPNIAGNGLLNGLNLQPITDILNELFSTSLTPVQVQPLIESGVSDLLTAVNWLADHAEDFGVDSTRIAVGGYSAGAFNALFAAYLGNNPNIAAVWSNAGSLGGAGNEALVLGATSTPVPVIAFHGLLDEVVPYAAFGTPFEGALNAEAIPHDFFTLATENHYFTKDLLVVDAPTKALPQNIETLVSEFMYAGLELDDLVQPASNLPVRGGIGLALLFCAVGAIYAARRSHAGAR